jgi:hypothetical protein
MHVGCHVLILLFKIISKKDWATGPPVATLLAQTHT